MEESELMQMDTNELLDMACYAGKLLIESGAEIYRVEETMVRLCTNFAEVEDAQSFVTPTGIMFSITVHKCTSTKILRVHSRGVNLNCIDKINNLSREAASQPYSVAKLHEALRLIAQEDRYSFWTTLFFGALSAGGFAIFFKGNYMDACCSFLIGMVIKTLSWLMEKRGMNAFFVNAIAGGTAAIMAILLHAFLPATDEDILIISSIMLFVPGLAITNAIRDTVAGDYLSGVARATEAFLVAIAIAVGIGFVLSMSIAVRGGVL